jgi:hypothetical protein
VLLLEDGLFVTYAPTATTFLLSPAHRALRERRSDEGIEPDRVRPGHRGGSSTTSRPPAPAVGLRHGDGGQRDFLDAKVAYGGTWGRRASVDATRKQGDGARDNVHSELNDVTLKLVQTGAATDADGQGNYYGGIERHLLRSSSVGVRAGPAPEPFANDFFYGDRLEPGDSLLPRPGRCSADDTALRHGVFSGLVAPVEQLRPAARTTPPIRAAAEWRT